jgi:hypothetical protein
MFDQGQASGVYSLLRASVSDRSNQISQMSGAARESLVLELEAARRRVDAAQAQVLASLESDETTTTRHGLTTANWFARAAHLPSVSPLSEARAESSARSLRASLSRSLSDDHPHLPRLY